MAFYHTLLKIIPSKEFEKSKWSLCKVEPVDNDDSYKNLIAYIWSIKNKHQLIVVNFSQYLTRGHIRIEGLQYGTDEWTFTDLLTQKKYSYKGEDLSTYGLFVDLDAWEGQIFDVKIS